MAIEKIEIEIAKEASDVMKLLVVLAKDIKQGKSVTEIGADALPKLMAAIDGIEGISGEVGTEAFSRTIGLHFGELVDALIKPKPAA